MPFRPSPKVVKHCPEGHVMEMAWRTCPRCTGRRAVSEGPGRDMADATVVFGAPPVAAPAPVPAPPPAWVARFEATHGPFAGRSVEVTPGRWKIGRGPRPEPGSVTVQIPDPGMSRDHFALEAGVAAVVMRDLGSTNGTYVNGARMERRILEDGDTLKAGESQFRVHLALRPPA
jgi:S-DNA-T family DNA segregation ATPase FtsK/SpoIIIE